MTVKNTSSVPDFGASSSFIKCEFSAISLAMALSSGWRAIMSADSSKSMWVGEAGRRAGARAWLSNSFRMNGVNCKK